MHSYMDGLVKADLLTNRFQKTSSRVQTVFPPRYYCVVKIIDDIPLHYILTLTDGLYIFDDRKNELKHCGRGYSKISYKINGPSQDMFIDSKDRLWIATVQSADRNDATADTFHHFDMNNKII